MLDMSRSRHITRTATGRSAGQPNVASRVAVEAHHRSGAGFHSKTRKQKRGNERAQLRKGSWS